MNSIADLLNMRNREMRKAFDGALIERDKASIRGSARKENKTVRFWARKWNRRDI